MDEEKKMTFGEHLEELRTRIFLSLGAVLVGFIICFILKDYILDVLNAPLLKATGGKLKILHLLDPFIISLRVSFIFGFILASPFVFWQMWAFVGAGLFKREKKYVYIFGPFTLVLFLAGVAFSYYMMGRFGIKFLLSLLPADEYEAAVAARPYLSFILQIPLVMGLVFQLPIVMMFLMKVGIVDIETFKKQRKVAIIVIFVVAAVLTPPDVFTQLMMGIPLVGLYELGLLLGRASVRKKRPEGSS
jgi:sec-independent protein translocase protein TatC